jgi:hypothetical protein
VAGSGGTGAAPAPPDLGRSYEFDDESYAGLLELPGRDDVYRVVEVTMLSPDQAAAAEKRLEGDI